MKDIPVNKVDSSNIAGVGYDAASKTLRVEFHGSGRAYDYADVPSNVHADLVGAKSVGRFFAEHIRDKFATTKVPKKDDDHG